MIQHRLQIMISAPPQTVFHHIDTMPDKFPVYRILETKPFLFIRMLLVDGFHSAWEVANFDKPIKEVRLRVGETMGPFTLDERIAPSRYWFSLKSFFISCRTGYILEKDQSETVLHFDLIAENPCFMEKIWWFFVKPIHGFWRQRF